MCGPVGPITAAVQPGKKEITKETFIFRTPRNNLMHLLYKYSLHKLAVFKKQIFCLIASEFAQSGIAWLHIV